MSECGKTNKEVDKSCKLNSAHKCAHQFTTIYCSDCNTPMAPISYCCCIGRGEEIEKETRVQEIKKLKEQYNVATKSAAWWENKENAIAKCWADNVVENAEKDEEIEKLKEENKSLKSKLDVAEGALILARGNSEAIIEELTEKKIDLPLGLWSIFHAMNKALATIRGKQASKTEGEGA